MRALTKVQQARKDKVERIYLPNAEIFVRCKSGFDVKVLTWGLEQIIVSRPWCDSHWYETERYDLDFWGRGSKAHEVQGSCRFTWQERPDGRFCTTTETLSLRRGQLLAFENWVEFLVEGLANLSLPHVEIHDVRGTVTFFRHVPYVQPGTC